MLLRGNACLVLCCSSPGAVQFFVSLFEIFLIYCVNLVAGFLLGCFALLKSAFLLLCDLLWIVLLVIGVAFASIRVVRSLDHSHQAAVAELDCRRS